MNPQDIKVGIIDDHEAIRIGIEAALQHAGVRMKIVGTSATVADFLALGRRTDVVLLDLSLADGSDPKENTENLIAAGHRVLVYTIADNIHMLRRALAGGAAGVCRKSEPIARTIESIFAVAAGKNVLSQEVLAAIEGDTSYLTTGLGAREREVLALYVAGLEVSEVAQLLAISDNSVKEYLKRIRIKYTLADRPAGSKLDLLRRAIEDGIVPPVLPANHDSADFD